MVNILSGNKVYAVNNAEEIQAPENIRSIRNTDTSIRIKWKAISNVDGYMIYRYKTSSKKYTKIHTVTGTKANQWMQWTDKKLKTNKVYKYKMASYKMSDGKKQVSSLSDWVSAKTYKRNSKKINARAPKVSRKEVYLGL